LSEQLTHAARDLVGLVLKDNPERLHHSAGVAARAQALAVAVPLSAADTLVASAWLHDIGYGSQLRDSRSSPWHIQATGG
jgi:HD superfamily phosphodiesterase